MMPTAEEFLRNFKDVIGLRSQSSPLGSEATEIEVMIEFAKLHVEAALKEASRKVTCSEETQYDEYDNAVLIAKINKDSILNAYPTSSIK